MNKIFKYLPITELLNTIIDNRGKTVPTSEKGIPLIATNCIKRSSIYPTLEKVRYVNEETHTNWFRAHLEPNDILFVNKGTPGRVCLVPNPVSFCAAQDMMAFRCNDALIDYKYLFAVLRSDEIQKKIANNHVGLVIPHLRKQDLSSILIPLRERKEQEYIGNLYFSISEKIELNNRINTELEAMAKTMYDYWFVQFDFQDANGKPYKTSGGKMVWNAELKREIPKGWKSGNLDDLGEIVGGSTPSKAIVDNFCSEGIPWITPKDLSLNSGKKFISKGELDVSKKGFKSASLKTLPKDSILLSSRAPIGYMVIARNDVTTNQGFKSFVPNKGYSTPFIYYTIKNNMKVIEANASGSTFKEISGGVLKSISVCLSNKNIIDLFTKKVESIFKQQDILEQENQELASLRDWLLPMLMNGQVSVGDVAEELGMVAEPVVEYKEIKTNKTRTDKSEAFLKKVMLGCHLIYRFHQEREFGHIKFMKLLYLCEQVGEMNLMTNYQKAAAGPFDKKTLASIEKYIQTSGWFKINKEPYTGSNGKVYERTFYSLTGKSTDYQKYYNNYFESEKDKIEKLIQLFKGANSRKCEIVATTYYAYNELLKKNVLINENSLIKGFFEFHPQKGKNFKEFDVKEQLSWMKNNGVYPKRQID